MNPLKQCSVFPNLPPYTASSQNENVSINVVEIDKHAVVGPTNHFSQQLIQEIKTIFKKIKNSFVDQVGSENSEAFADLFTKCILASPFKGAEQRYITKFLRIVRGFYIQGHLIKVKERIEHLVLNYQKFITTHMPPDILIQAIKLDEKQDERIVGSFPYHAILLYCRNPAFQPCLKAAASGFVYSNKAKNLSLIPVKISLDHLMASNISKRQVFKDKEKNPLKELAFFESKTKFRVNTANHPLLTLSTKAISREFIFTTLTFQGALQHFAQAVEHCDEEFKKVCIKRVVHEILYTDLWTYFARPQDLKPHLEKMQDSLLAYMEEDHVEVFYHFALHFDLKKIIHVCVLKLPIEKICPEEQQIFRMFLKFYREACESNFSALEAKCTDVLYQHILETSYWKKDHCPEELKKALKQLQYIFIRWIVPDNREIFYQFASHFGLHALACVCAQRLPFAALCENESPSLLKILHLYREASRRQAKKLKHDCVRYFIQELSFKPSQLHWNYPEELKLALQEMQSEFIPYLNEENREIFYRLAVRFQLKTVRQFYAQSLLKHYTFEELIDYFNHTKPRALHNFLCMEDLRWACQFHLLAHLRNDLSFLQHRWNPDDQKFCMYGKRIKSLTEEELQVLERIKQFSQIKALLSDIDYPCVKGLSEVEVKWILSLVDPNVTILDLSSRDVPYYSQTSVYDRFEHESIEEIAFIPPLLPFRFSQLKQLNLARSHFNLSILQGLESLTHLDLSRTSLTHLKDLPDLVSLQVLNLSYTNILDISILKKKCPKLTQLYFANCSKKVIEQAKLLKIELVNQ